MNEVLRYGSLPRDQVDAINEAFASLWPLLNISTVDGQPCYLNRDPTGWVLSIDLSQYTGTQSFGTSSDPAVSPPGVFSPPTLTVPGPPTWTPPTGSNPIEIDSYGIIWLWNGSAWIVGSGRYPSTASASVAPTAPLIIPTMPAGPPTWTGTKGEVVCDGPYLYQYTGSSWVTYLPVPASSLPIPSNSLLYVNSATPPVQVPVTVNSTANQYILTQTSSGVPTFTNVLTLASTAVLNTAPATFVTLPKITLTGTPTFTIATGTPVWNSTDNRLWISTGGGSFVSPPTGSGTANKVLKWLTAYTVENSSIEDDGTAVTFSEPLMLMAGTTTEPSLNFPVSVWETSPAEGDMGYDGTHLYFRKSGSTVDLLAGGGSSPTSTNGQVAVTPAFALNGSYANITGATFTAPSTGTYQMLAQVVTHSSGSSSSVINCKLVNTTTSTDLSLPGTTDVDLAMTTVQLTMFLVATQALASGDVVHVQGQDVPNQGGQIVSVVLTYTKLT